MGGHVSIGNCCIVAFIAPEIYKLFHLSVELGRDKVWSEMLQKMLRNIFGAETIRRVCVFGLRVVGFSSCDSL